MACSGGETSARIEVKIRRSPDHVRRLKPLCHGAHAKIGGNVARDADIEAIVEGIGFHGFGGSKLSDGI